MMSDRVLKRSFIVVILLLLFVLGFYVGNNNSYSVKISEKEKLLEPVINNNELILNKFSFSKDKGIAGDKIPVQIDISGSKLSGATIQLVRDDGKYTISLMVEDIDTNPYVYLPNYINTGTYKVKSIVFVALNSDETTYSRNFTSKPLGSGDVYYEFNNNIYLEANQNNVEIDLIKSIKLERSTFTQGENVKVALDYDKDVRAIRLNFKYSDGYSGIYSYVNSISKNPYIVIAKSAKIGDYVLDSIYVETYNYGSVIYRYVDEEGSKYLEYDANYAVLQSNSENSSNVYYNNSDINANVISSIKNSNIINEVHIMAHDEPVVVSELFAALKGTNKRLHIYYKDVEYVFEGSDITEASMFDATANLILSADYDKIDINGLVLKQASNGQLPGKALVKIRENGLFSKAFDKDNINIYAFDEKDSSYILVEENVKKQDSTYSFNLTNSSIYFLTNYKIEKLKETSSASKEENVTTEKNNLNKILIIIIAVLVLILAVLIIVLLRKKGDNEKKEVNEDEVFEEIKQVDDNISEEELINNVARANEESIDDE